jgi:hypothetical protein
MNSRLVKILRGLMSAYALRWKVLRNDPVESAEARRLLARAVQLRDWSINSI